MIEFMSFLVVFLVIALGRFAWPDIKCSWRFMMQEYGARKLLISILQTFVAAFIIWALLVGMLAL